MSGKGIGYGKTILFGEHFVVYGLPGIAGAIADHTVAEVENSTSFEFVDERPCIEGYKEKKKNEIQRQIDSLKEIFSENLAKSNVKIVLKGNLKCASGIGASGALASAIARALSEHFSLNLSDERINEIAFEAEKAGAGNPSGIDNTVSTYGGMLTFEKNLEGGKNKIKLIEVKESLKIVLASTGITQETKEIVGAVKAEKERNPEKFEQIFSEYKKVYENGLEALKNGDVEKVGQLMDKNQGLLREITVSCDEIEKIVSIAKENGALGAKLTGTGRGGLVICLVPDEITQEKVVLAVQKAGFEATKTELGKK